MTTPSSHPTSAVNGKLLTRVTSAGERIVAVSIDTGRSLLAASDLRRVGRVSWALDDAQARQVPLARLYTRSRPEPGPAEAGRFLVAELAGLDESLPPAAELVQEGHEPVPFRERDHDGRTVLRPRLQTRAWPRPFGERLQLTLHLEASVLTAEDDSSVQPGLFHVDASAGNLIREALGDFESGVMHGEDLRNTLPYRLRRPRRPGQHPLMVFLHGSGQVGDDGTAHLVSSRGAVGVLEYEDCWVLAPQLPTIVDEYDEPDPQGRRIYWQSRNRRRLLLELIRRLVQENPSIDPHRLYVQGLSRGGEGALHLVLDAPELFAAAGIISGREAGTVEWIDGCATTELLEPARRTPLWFFHAAQDEVSPVEGTRRNVVLLRELGHPCLRYTEIDRVRRDDAGYVSSSAHNAWEVAYNSPDFWAWMLGHRRDGIRAEA